MPRQRIVILGLAAAVGLGAVGLALLARETGDAIERAAPPVPIASEPPSEPDAAAPIDAATPPVRGDDYACALPEIAIEEDPRCAAG